MNPPWDFDRVSNQARWAALRSLLVLKDAEPAYEALVEALMRGDGLGECVRTIETAMERVALPVATPPPPPPAPTALAAELEQVLLPNANASPPGGVGVGGGGEGTPPATAPEPPKVVNVKPDFFAGEDVLKVR
jgi:hypothetical protein